MEGYSWWNKRNCFSYTFQKETETSYFDTNSRCLRWKNQHNYRLDCTYESFFLLQRLPDLQTLSDLETQPDYVILPDCVTYQIWLLFIFLTNMYVLFLSCAILIKHVYLTQTGKFVYLNFYWYRVVFMILLFVVLFIMHLFTTLRPGKDLDWL